MTQIEPYFVPTNQTFAPPPQPQGLEPPHPAENEPDDDLFFDTSKLKKQYEDYLTVKLAEINERKEARRYYHGSQWTAHELKILKKRGQPPMTKNIIARKINGINGTVERLRQDPKAFARKPKNEQGADVASATLNYALDTADWEAISSRSARDGSITGISGIELTLVPGDLGDPEIGINILADDMIFYDPKSYEADFSDAAYLGIAKWMDLEMAKELFPDKADELDGLMDYGAELTVMSDRDIKWASITDKTIVMIYQTYRSKGEWCWCFYSNATKLAEGKSPFIDEKGKTMSNLIMWSAAVDQDGDRYGFHRNLKSPQDGVNHRTSKMLAISNSRRIIADKGAVDNVEKARIEWARHDGWVETIPNRKITPDNQQQDFASQLQLLQEDKEEINSLGPNDAVLSQDMGQASGRAIALQQTAGLAALGPYMVEWRHFKLRVYRAVWNAIQRYWTKERWIRVTDNEGLAQFIQLNGLQQDQFGRPAIVNYVGSLDVDIKLDEGPDVVSVMADAYEMIKNDPDVPPDIKIEIMPGLKSDLRKKILERMRAKPQPDPMKLIAQQEAIKQAQAKTAKTKTSAFKDVADAAKSLTAAHQTFQQGQMEEAGILGPGQGQGQPQPHLPMGQARPPLPGAPGAAPNLAALLAARRGAPQNRFSIR